MPCFHGVDFCIWPGVLPHFRRRRGSRGHKHFRRGRFASSSQPPPAVQIDIVTRLIGQWLSERLGQPFIIENRPGAGTNLATEMVVRAPPDGYTYFSAGPASAINATLYDKLSFNFIRDTAPVAGLMRVSNVLVVHPSFPAKTVPEFIAYAKANPGKLSMASGGIGSGSHMAGELFKMMAGVDMVHVPYRGAGPALGDLLGGQVQVMFDLMPNSIEHIKAGKLRGLAVTTATRSPDLPDIPTVGDFVPGYEASAVFGIVAPRDTPADTVDKLNKEINAGLADPKHQDPACSTSAVRCSPARPPISASSLPKKQRSGAR